VFSLLLSACVSSPLQASLVPEPGSAAASQASRPDWSVSPGFAPGLTLEQRSLLSASGHQGDLRGALLWCDVTPAEHGASSWSPRAMAGWIYVDELGVRTTPDPSHDTLTLSAPSMFLKSGDRVQIVLQEQGASYAAAFDTLHGEYTGSLPLVLRGASSHASCWRVSESEVNAALSLSLSLADPALDRLSERVVSLERADFGHGQQPDPRLALESAAALVGWSHPELSSRLERIARADRSFSESVGASVASVLSDAPEAAHVDDAVYRLRQSVCPRPLGYWRHGMAAECVVELDASVGQGAVPVMELVFADGGHRSAYLWSVPEGAHALTLARSGVLGSGERGRMMVRYARKRVPIALRIRGSAEVHWLSLSGDE
jgi:hypothetical protein